MRMRTATYDDTAASTERRAEGYATLALFAKLALIQGPTHNNGEDIAATVTPCTGVTDGIVGFWNDLMRAKVADTAAGYLSAGVQKMDPILQSTCEPMHFHEKLGFSSCSPSSHDCSHRLV